MAFLEKLRSHSSGLSNAVRAVEVAATVARALSPRREAKYPNDEKTNVSTNRSRVPSSVVSTSTGTFESCIWGQNPFPNLKRFSHARASAQSEAVRTGVQFVSPICFTEWEYGSIWSASVTTASSPNWTSDFQQGKARWYAFPTISPTDVDHAYAAAWGDDSKVDGSHLTSIEAFVNMLEFKNTGTAPCEVDVFQCYPRDDIPITGLSAGYIKDQYDLLYQGSSSNLVGPDLLCSTGFTNWQPTITGAVALDPLAWDFTPFDHPLWRELLQCRPYYHRLMSPGDSTRVHFGTHRALLNDPAEDILGSDSENPTQAVWATKRKYGPIYLMRVRGTLVQAENTSTDVKLGDGSTWPAGENHPRRPVVNYGNFLVDFAWKSDCYCRAVSVGNSALPQMGYYGGVYPRLNTQTFDNAHEFTRVTNNPAEVQNVG